MKSLLKKTSFAITLIICCVNPLSAAVNKYALLVGISEYKTKPLAGPVNDVKAMRSTLIKHWNFSSKNIDILLNSRATKSNIVKGIKSLHKKSTTNDEIFIYLSGHGTSRSDKNMSTPLPTTTGAFIPIDVNHIKNVGELISRLLIGKRDLRPLLKKLDDGRRKVFVAIDACYSGNTVRGNFSDERLPSRFMSIKDLLPKRGFGDDLTPMNTADWIMAGENNNNNYPYKNVFYLSASGEHEPAEDIPPAMIEKFPTIDLKPHGAFTDSLLRTLNNRQHSDIDNNGVVTYAELKKTVQNIMRQNKFSHTPQSLPSLAEDTNNLASRPIFGTTRGLVREHKKATIANKPDQSSLKPSVIKSPLPNVKFPGLKVKIDSSLYFLNKTLKSEKSIVIVNNHEDVFLKKHNNDIVLLSPSGDLIYALKDGDIAELETILKRRNWVKKILHKKFEQKFLIEFELYNAGSGSTLIEEQTVSFSIKSSKDAYLLLIGFDPSGVASVLFPYLQKEIVKYPGMAKLSLNNLSTVRAPFGKDLLQLYAFDQLSEEYKQLVAKKFDLESPLATTFEKLINNKNIDKASATLELVTTARVK